MAQYRPFAIWDGVSSLPSGIDQNQNILIGVADQNYYRLGDIDWWAGPDESLGYIIAYYDHTFTHPNPLEIPAGIGFLRSNELNDTSFLEIFNYLRAQLSLSSLSNANEAKAWLVANGYWTSYGEAPWTYGNSSSQQSGGWIFYSAEGTLDVGPPVNQGNAIFVVQGNPLIETFDPNTGTGKTLYFNRFDLDGVDHATEFESLQTYGGAIVITQNGQSAIYYTTTPNMFVYNNNNTSQSFFMINTSMLRQTSSTDGPFTFEDVITLEFRFNL